MEKVGTYRITEPNLIGQIGEVVATYILKKLYPHSQIARSNTYPYYNIDPKTERADFEIHSGGELIGIPVSGPYGCSVTPLLLMDEKIFNIIIFGFFVQLHK